eukprot:scaffold13084_cov112-Isochrysis_galbana.AAC.2
MCDTPGERHPLVPSPACPSRKPPYVRVGEGIDGRAQRAERAQSALRPRRPGDPHSLLDRTHSPTAHGDARSGHIILFLSLAAIRPPGCLPRANATGHSTIPWQTSITSPFPPLPLPFPPARDLLSQAWGGAVWVTFDQREGRSELVRAGPLSPAPGRAPIVTPLRLEFGRLAVLCPLGCAGGKESSLGSLERFVSNASNGARVIWGFSEVLVLRARKVGVGMWGPVGPTLPVRARKLPHVPERGVRRAPRADPPPSEHEVQCACFCAGWLKSEPEREQAVRSAAKLFVSICESQAPFVAIENPKMHSLATDLVGGRKPDQYVQPYEHGTG